MLVRPADRIPLIDRLSLINHFNLLRVRGPGRLFLHNTKHPSGLIFSRIYATHNYQTWSLSQLVCMYVRPLFLHSDSTLNNCREIYQPPKFGSSQTNYSIPEDGTAHLHCPVQLEDNIPLSFPLVSREG